MDLNDERAFIHVLASMSGDFIRAKFRQPGLQVDIKGDQTPVTEADRGAERLMREQIRRRFPGHGILGEEYGAEREDSEFVWVLDPVDGTRTFTAGVPLFGTLIALLHRGQPVLGAIHQPILRQLLIGDGKSTDLNGRPVKVRPCDRLEDAVVLTTELAAVARHRPDADFASIESRAALVRTWGDCYGYLLLATGYADVVFDPEMNTWDIQALIPIVRGAGGIITAWDGGDPVPADGIIAAAPELHAEVLRLLNGKANNNPGAPKPGSILAQRSRNQRKPEGWPQ